MQYVGVLRECVQVKVLIACEYSGTVRDAFIAKGHQAISCDILPSESPNGPHILGDVCDHINDGWDLMIAHPPCTYLCVSGARWWMARSVEQELAIKFVHLLGQAPIKRIAIENPIGILSTRFGRPTQIVQPWEYGHGETKATCLWLKNLPPLTPTNIVAGREHRIHRMSPGPKRSKERSRTYLGIADAMATQWGSL